MKKAHWFLRNTMPKNSNPDLSTFGKNLARLRKQAGYTQQQLADEVGISRRMLVYYESQTKHPPTNLLPDLAQALGVTADQILGLEPMEEVSPKNVHFWKQIRKAEDLPASDRRALLQVLDGLLAKNGMA